MKLGLLFAVGVILTLHAAPARAGDAAAGEEKYATGCGNCHGRTGRGMGSFPSLMGKDAEYVSNRLAQYRAGERVGPNSALMIPHARNLSDEDIANLASYISTTFQ
jgi:cytochrome c553